MNIIGDVAGNYETLMALVAKMPKDTVVSVGDMVDRGPKSKQVLEWFKENGKAIIGNHEHMLIDAYDGTRKYESGIWLTNGGVRTLTSFGLAPNEIHKMPEDIINWLKSLPYYIETDDFYITHAALPTQTPERSLVNDEYKLDMVWNRFKPLRCKKYNIFGHNHVENVTTYRDAAGEFAVCIDTDWSGVLTGIHIPSMEVFTQEYID